MYHTNFWEVNDEQTEFIFSYPENYMTGSVWFKQMGYLCVAIFGIYVWQRLFNNFNQLTYRGVSSISTGDKELAYVFERMNEPESKKTIYGYDVPDVAGACINKPDTVSINNFKAEQESFKRMRKELLSYYDMRCKEIEKPGN